MVICPSGLGVGLQNQIGRFDSYYHLNGFGGNPRIDDESMSTKFAFEAHVDGHSAFNGGVVGSRPTGGTRCD